MLFEPAHLVLQETEVGDTEKENIREIEREREREIQISVFYSCLGWDRTRDT